MVTREELYEEFKNELQKRGIKRNIKKNTFLAYMTQMWSIPAILKYLSVPKKYKNNKTWKTKTNPEEVVDFAKITSIQRAAKEYGVSERTIFRYINKIKEWKKK